MGNTRRAAECNARAVTGEQHMAYRAPVDDIAFILDAVVPLA